MLSNHFTDRSVLVLSALVKAISKGVDEDMREYCSANNTITGNGFYSTRSDKINTNIYNMIEPETAEIKFFKRSNWTGLIIIDRFEKRTYSVLTRNTLKSIPRRKRANPHYMQSFLFVENGDLTESTQIDFGEYGFPVSKCFTAEEYEEDFLTIMCEELSQFNNFQHWDVVYEASRFDISRVVAVLLDKDFNTISEISLMELLKPNFGGLTAADTGSAAQMVHSDVHNLVSVKPGLVSAKTRETEKHTEITPKNIEQLKES